MVTAMIGLKAGAARKLVLKVAWQEFFTVNEKATLAVPDKLVVERRFWLAC